ncbi:hypothetical protein K1719_021708 [Acacia pycnantha]|nr:hypothetical protein K1719_021708 [Acacia pycnantha]
MIHSSFSWFSPLAKLLDLDRKNRSKNDKVAVWTDSFSLPTMITLKLSRPGSLVLGVGFTGSLATRNPKFGEHRKVSNYIQSRCDPELG